MRSLHDEAHGPDASSRSYTGRGRRFQEWSRSLRIRDRTLMAGQRPQNIPICAARLMITQEWITALDTMGALHPRAVVAGHKRPGSGDDPRDVEQTRQYIRVFDAILQEAGTAREVYDMMISRYPSRLCPDALWTSARELKK